MKNSISQRNSGRRGVRQVFLATLAVSLPLVSGFAQAAWAFEVEPNEYVPAPAGTNVFLGYGIFQSNNSYKPAKGKTVSNDTNLQAYEMLARFATYFNVGGMLGLAEVIQPLGILDNPSIGGTHYANSSGYGDTTVAAALWPINNDATHTYLGVAAYVTLPSGAYSANQTINLGGNRVVYDPQVSLHQGLSENWSIDLTGDLIFYGDNTHANAQGGKLTQNTTTQLQAFVNYVWPIKVTTSLGIESELGGNQSVSGENTGQKTEFNRLRLVSSYFVTPRFQLLGEINTDISHVGGYQEAVGITIRSLYVF